MSCHEVAVNAKNRQSLTFYLVFDKHDALVRLL